MQRLHGFDPDGRGITGQVPTVAIGTDAFQECDTVGITRSVTKHNQLVTRASDIPMVIRQAFHIATTGRPGPVLVDIPKRHRRPQQPQLALRVVLAHR
ncbi:MAG: thiamine pyrophosphate-binding protein [Microthrixaceae bacterium]|nr:thiamine pyrophosphate-binding protein [Microthrixaceae bacterium]